MNKDHIFSGKWITSGEFCELEPRNVFHRQLDPIDLDCSEHRNRHLLFRRSFCLDSLPEKADLFISADDHYKLYINGRYICEGPSPSYHTAYNYNRINVRTLLVEGENIIAIHTLYQGLINRVWQSGDNRHGLILDLVCDERCILCSDESFKIAYHSAFSELGTFGYDTGFLEQYDSRALEVGFELPSYDDSAWESARVSKFADHTLTEQKSSLLVSESIEPVSVLREDNTLLVDFGAVYVGYLNVTARGASDGTVTVRMGQELLENGRVRFDMRANCRYEEKWILSDGTSTLDQYDYKSFRYAELILPEKCEIVSISLSSRHFPFTLACEMKKEMRRHTDLERIWELCINTQRYGVQDAVLDCMDREKGFYLGDGCYTALTHYVLTGNDIMVRKLIDEAFSTTFITDGLVTCINCSFMQEIAEYPLMLVYLVFWHYKLSGDKDYLEKNYQSVISLLEVYRRNYEKDFLLSHLDKWCVVEWPMNFRDGYDVDITEGKVCTDAHVSINAYYLEAIKTANKMASILGYEAYRDEKELTKAFFDAFYLKDRHLFKDSVRSDHISMIGNIFPFAFDLIPDSVYTENIIAMVKEKGIRSVSFFGAFLLLEGLVRSSNEDMIGEILLDTGAWLRMLREGATATFEGWGKDTKWNTSLFHLTLSYAAVFMADIDLKKLFL